MARLSSAETEAFLSSLPAAALSPHEVALRQALLDFVNARWPKPFPLAEWIDRRVGGELELRRNEAGRDELLLRGNPRVTPQVAAAHAAGAVAEGPPPAADVLDREAFLAGLDPGSFGAEEEALRDSVFEFLARWNSRDLATLADLAGDTGVRRRAAALLPGDVPLKEWIEMRIGGEVEFKSDARGQEIVHLTAKARPVVTAKYAELAKSAGKGQGRARQQPTAQPQATLARQAQPPQSTPSREAFFAGLPTGELLQGELSLRSALVDFIERWPRAGAQLGRPAGSCPLLSDLGQDSHVLSCRSFLPQNVPLKEWIDRRIGGEIEVRKDERGQFELRLRGAVATAKARKAPSPPRRTAAELAEDWVNKLPTDRHTEAEADLRQAILGYIEAKDMAVQLPEMSKDPLVHQTRSACLPPEVPLRVWIDRRIGGEVETFKDDQGRCIAQMRGNRKSDAEPAPDREEQKERFFSALPQDGFTPDEEGLREALLDFLASWKAKDLPTLSHAGGDARVKKFRAKILPKGVAVTLRDWIDRRIGGEVEMFEAPSGQLQFALRGQAGPTARKRAGSGGEQGPPRKKGGAPGVL